MKTAILASLLASAAAFAPASQKVGSTTALNDFKGELGAQVPLGFWDPLGVTKNCSPQRFEELQYLELKHGRIAMLAFLGNISVLGGARFPGMLSSDVAFADMPSHGIEAIKAVPVGGLWQIVGFLFLMEVGMTSKLKDGEFMGDFTTVFDFGWQTWEGKDDLKKAKRSIEINNGRAAMMGITGLMVHESIGNLDSMPIISL